MRLLLFNLATDADDPVLGFTCRWIRALAERAEFIHVITMRAGRFELPANVRVHSVGKEKSYSEARRVAEFYKILSAILWNDRIDICFSHMMPRFTVLAGPILQARRVPVVTWYAHPSITWILRLAHRFSARMVASVATAYPYKRDKLIAVGQGIDTALFAPEADVEPADPPMILCAGRLSPVKDHPTLLKAAALLRQNYRQPFQVVIVGGPATARDDAYAGSLRRQTQQLGLDGVVRFEPAVSIEQLPPWYRRATVYANMTPTGSGDKVVWEAMACAKPCVVANEGFRETLGKFADHLLFPYGDAEALAARLQLALSLAEDERRRMGAYLREQVERMHGLERLADVLIEIFADCIEKRPLRRALGVSQADTPHG